MKSITYVNDKFPDTSGWKARHLAAVRGRDQARGGAVAMGIDAWACYASEHRRRYEAPISEDGFLGPLWAEWGKALRGLLNGDMGNFDCGTLDSIIYDNAREQGFSPDTW